MQARASGLKNPQMQGQKELPPRVISLRGYSPIHYSIMAPFTISRDSTESGDGAEKSKSPAKLCLVAVIGTTCLKGIWGIGGAIYTSFMPNITKNSLNSFSCSVSPKETSSTFTTYALKLMASVSRDVKTQIYTHSKSALQFI